MRQRVEAGGARSVRGGLSEHRYATAEHRSQLSNNRRFDLAISLLQAQDFVGAIDAIKIDVEGAEDVVLAPFFRDAPKSMWPRLILLEDARSAWTIDLFSLLASLGYIVVSRTRLNVMLRLGG
jgi:hypothetical protein